MDGHNHDYSNIMDFVPHGYCLLWRPDLVIMHLGGDVGIFVAYMSIPIAIEYVRRKKNLPFNNLAACFAAFIFFCGIGHLIDVLTLFFGGIWYWVEGVNKVVTALVSLATAVYTFKLIPVLKLVLTPNETRPILDQLAMYKETEFWMELGRGFSIENNKDKK